MKRYRGESVFARLWQRLHGEQPVPPVWLVDAQARPLWAERARAGTPDVNGEAAVNVNHRSRSFFPADWSLRP